LALKLVEVDSRDSYGRTALHYACSCGNIDIAGELLAAGAQVNARNHAGETPLLKACGFTEIEMVEYLLAQPNIDTTIRDYVGTADQNNRNAFDIIEISMNVNASRPEFRQRLLAVRERLRPAFEMDLEPLAHN